MAVLLTVLLAGCTKAPEPPKPSIQAPAAPAESKPDAAPAAALSEKDKARAEPYANDLGPASLPADLLAGYPPASRAGYLVMIDRCAQCHTAARPLNSQFVETDVWKRYVKRMMSKPGCEISTAQGKQIWEFLVHDSRARKTGAAEAAWKAHRAALLAEFKAKHPERFKLLYP